MKKLAVILLLLVCVVCLLTACNITEVTYQVTSPKGSYSVNVGDQLDFTSYFTITSSEGTNVPVLDTMIDASTADTSKPGAFIVTCTYENQSCTIIFAVNAKEPTHTHEFSPATCTKPATCSCGETQGASLGHTEVNDDAVPATCTTAGLTAGKHCSVCNEVTVPQTTVPATGHTTTNGTCTRCGETIGNQGGTTANLSDVFANYDDYAKWNFEIVFGVTPSDTQSFEGWTYIYAYDGLDCCLTDQDGTFADYVVLGESNATYYYDNVDGTYTVYQFDYETLYTEYVDYIELSTLANFTFVANGDHYSASNPSDAGDEIFGGYADCTYTSLDLYVASGKLAKIVAVMHDSENNCDWTFTVEFTKHGNILIDVSDLVIDGETGGDVGEDIPTSATIDLTNASNKVSASSEKLEFADGNLKVTIDRETSSTALSDNTGNGWAARIYTGATLTVEYPQMTKIVITCDGNTYNNKTYISGFDGMQVSGATITRQDNVITITLASAQDKFVSANLSSQVRVLSIEVFTTSNGNQGGGNTGNNNVMPEQSYNENNHIDYDDILYDAITKNDEAGGYIPSTALPSQGEYNVLVVPVEFSNDKFTTQELSDLNDAFNTKTSTGWESVSSYYYASSYGKLDLTFDIASKVTLNKTYQNFDGGNDYGADIVKLALDAMEANGFDFTKYDTDNNGVIDGIYIIYSAPIDYDGDYYWAYVTATEDETLYDNLYVYSYLFASVDFMYEDIETSDPSEFSPIDGLKLNAVTYIHETGHMLGLDDYYDYNPNQGSDEGLGCADMMDYTVGDHNAYSKLLLGWVKPTVVTQTQTVTISSFESSGQFIMILLDYDGSYFSEYLIIDLYSATGLNALHAGVDGSYLYEGASFGARIYHVDATINNPYSDKYFSFTDNNNSISKDPLIKLVEADGDKNFESDQYQGYSVASEDDLWQTGDVFSQIQANYTRNDGKVVNFDISFDSVTATSATITITFNGAN